MIHPSTKLTVIDNSGARRIRCIQVLRKSGRSLGNVGDILRISVELLRDKGNIRVRRGELHLAVVARIADKFKRYNGVTIKFDSNAAVVLNAKRQPYGTRFFGLIAKELRFEKYVKFLSMCPKAV